ncbi:hypothetical protein GpartN1_g5082.t1 [Galdieria partita]|uniref:Uncharacterized protein n=1 Tax=Galdieria partita TaxID=83374 RepID=A0A9C7Q0I9_9RHOD|nr:hypothetical protein GpartN1_g5082.t1 [Galdieria partita]
MQTSSNSQSTPPIGTFIQGVVKEVVSGDTLVITGKAARSGPPPEVRLSLSSLTAPRFSTKAKSTKQESDEPEPLEEETHQTYVELEPYAWESREALRELTIGKPVIFRIDYKADNVGGRLFGSVYLTDKRSISHIMVSSGLVKVRRPPPSSNEKRATDFDELVKLEEKAKEEKIGLHSNSPSHQVIRVTRQPFGREGLPKGVHIFGLVDQVLNGSTFRIFVPENLEEAKVSFRSEKGYYRLVLVVLPGVQSPGFKMESYSTETKLVPQPFALNARLFSEHRLLNRVVRLDVVGFDKNETIVGEVFLVSDGTEGGVDEHYIGEELLRVGLARTNNWGLELSPRSGQLMRAERSAIEQRLGVWQNYIPPANASVVLSGSFKGKVVEVISGDTIVVLPEGQKDSRRISFASLRSPKLGKGRELDAPLSFESREFLRKLLIGKTVNIEMDYKRKIQSSGSQNSGNLTIEFATVTLNGKDIGEMLVSKGFASVIRHKSGEERARNYEKYIELEKEAVLSRKGIHDSKGVVQRSRRINDLSSREATKRAKESFPHFQRTGPFHGIVEYVLSGSRYKILLSKESTMIAFALEYVRCPPPSKAPISKNDIGDAALYFARDNILQRDVEVSFSTVDRVGTFIGKLKVLEGSKSDEVEWEGSLLEQGLGYLNEVTRDKAPSSLKEKEKIAKESQKGLWSVFSKQNGAETTRTDTSIQFYGIVSEVSGGGRLYIQSEEAEAQNTLHAIQQQLSELGMNEEAGAEIPFSALKVGDKVAAKYSVDHHWYRGVILEKDLSEERLLVLFVDYGNEEWIPYDEIRSLPISSRNVPTAAYCVLLKDVVVPELTQEYGIEAGEALRDLVWNKRVLVQGTKRMDLNGIPQVIGDVFVENEEEKRNVAAELLRQGLARIIRRKDAKSRAAYERYGQDEQVARHAHRFLWRFGDAYASDEDTDI